MKGDKNDHYVAMEDPGGDESEELSRSHSSSLKQIEGTSVCFVFLKFNTLVNSFLFHAEHVWCDCEFIKVFSGSRIFCFPLGN